MSDNNVFIPESELSGDLKICRSTKGNWYSANMFNVSNNNGVGGIEMSEPEILSNLSAALTEVDEIMADLRTARSRVDQLRKFAAKLYAAAEPLKAVSE
jgi:hypothetical protein